MDTTTIWFLLACLSVLGIGLLIIRSVTRKDRTAMKNRKKHDPLNYYSNRLAADLAQSEAARNALLGGYRGGAQAYRAGTVGSPSNGSGYGASPGTGARMSIDEFSGIDQMIDPAIEEVGFAVGVVRGVRSFDVDKLGRLTGVTYKQIWKPGENEATCQRGRSDDLWAQFSFTLTHSGGLSRRLSEAVPVDYDKPHAMHDCKHGFYAYYDGSNDYRDDSRVSAVIEGCGETVIGSRGFRCMKARIVALQVPETVKPHIARMVARNYPDVPILETFEQMVSEFPPDSAGNEITPDNDPDFWTRPA